MQGKWENSLYVLLSISINLSVCKNFTRSYSASKRGSWLWMSTRIIHIPATNLEWQSFFPVFAMFPSLSTSHLLGLDVSYLVSMFLTRSLSFILGSIFLTRCLSLTLSLPKEFFHHTGREKKSTFNYFPYFFIDKCSTVSFIRSLE